MRCLHVELISVENAPPCFCLRLKREGGGRGGECVVEQVGFGGCLHEGGREGRGGRRPGAALRSLYHGTDSQQFTVNKWSTNEFCICFKQTLNSCNAARKRGLSIHRHHRHLRHHRRLLRHRRAIKSSSHWWLCSLLPADCVEASGLSPAAGSRRSSRRSSVVLMEKSAPGSAETKS